MKKGFSLIEIIVVMTIIIVLSSLGIGIFNTSRDRARLEDDVSKIVLAVRKAQNSALAPSRSETGVSNEQTLCAVGISLNEDTGVIQPFYRISTLGSSSCGTVKINYPTSNWGSTKLNYVRVNKSLDFEFSVPFAETTQKQVTLSLGDISKSITVTSSGLIKVE